MVLLLWTIFVISVLVLLCFRACLFIGALLSPAGKGWPLRSCLWRLIVKLSLSIGILGKVWCLIVSIPNLCPLSYIDWKVKGQPWPLELIYSHCLNGLTYQVRIMTLASTVFTKSTVHFFQFKRIRKKNDLRLDVKQIKVNLGSSFEQTC